MEDKLIVIENGKKFKFDNLKSFIKAVLADDYFEMTDEQKKNELEKKTTANALINLNNVNIADLRKNKNNYDDKSFILYDEITFILSLVKFNIIVLLEHVDANIFGKYINLNRENLNDNYIIINKFADEIIKNYLKIK